MLIADHSPKTSKLCPECGIEFLPAVAAQKFCTVECRNPEIACAYCQKTFRPHQRNANRFCSKACAWGDKYHAGYVDGAGYVRVYVGKGYPGADSKGHIKEHRRVMQEHLGRHLLPTETVHHINGDRADNRLENLEFRVGQHGKGATLHCPTCTCGVDHG